MEDPDTPRSPIPSENRIVTFDLPFPLALPDLLGAEEIYVAGQPPAAIGLARQQNERATIRTSGILMGGDPYGRASFTAIQVRFHATASPEILSWDEDRLIAVAVERTNVLLEHYRDVFDSPLVRRIRAEHIVHFRIIDHDENTEPNVRFFSRGNGPIHVGTSAEDREREQELRARLQTSDQAHFLRTMELDVRAHFSTGDNRLAVVEAASLFESWLKSSLRAAYEAQGMTSESALRKLIQTDRRGDPKVTKHSQHQFLGVSALIDDVVPDATGYADFADSAEYGNWVLAKNLRNDIIHGTLDHVSTEEAERAVSAFFAAIHHLQEHAEMT